MVLKERNELQRITYQRFVLLKAGELSKKHGGLRKIPAHLLEENGIELEYKGRATTVVIRFPDPEVMERRLAGAQTAAQIAEEIMPFKLPSEPTPLAVSRRPVTMEDFWIGQGWYRVDGHGWRLTKAFWKEDETVKTRAIRFLLDRVLEKNPREVIFEDFKNNMLGGLISQHYSCSPYQAVCDAYPELDIKPWEMPCVPNGFYKKKENRVAAVRWLVGKSGKEPREITVGDFDSNGLSGLIGNYYSDSPHRALSEACPELGIRQWEMERTPNFFYNEKENRVAAVTWLVGKSGKEPREIRGEDFDSNRLGGLLNTDFFKGSPYRALLEAGFVSPEDERYMTTRNR